LPVEAQHGLLAVESQQGTTITVDELVARCDLWVWWWGFAVGTFRSIFAGIVALFVVPVPGTIVLEAVGAKSGKIRAQLVAGFVLDSLADFFGIGNNATLVAGPVVLEVVVASRLVDTPRGFPVHDTLMDGPCTKGVDRVETVFAIGDVVAARRGFAFLLVVSTLFATGASPVLESLIVTSLVKDALWLVAISDKPRTIPSLAALARGVIAQTVLTVSSLCRACLFAPVLPGKALAVLVFFRATLVDIDASSEARADVPRASSGGTGFAQALSAGVKIRAALCRTYAEGDCENRKEYR